MKNNILLIGLGYFGKTIAKKLAEYHQDVMAVDIKEERVSACLPFVTNGRIGDATDTDFIGSLGPENYDLCIVAIGDNFMSSLQATAFLKDHGAKYVVSRACSDTQEKFLLRNGADKVVFPEKTLANWTAVRYAANHISDFIPISTEFSILEIDMPEKWVGKTIKDLNIRQVYHLNIIAIRDGNRLIPNIDPLTTLEKGCTLLVMGKEEDIAKCFK